MKISSKIFMKAKYEWGALLIKDKRIEKQQQRNKSLKSVLEPVGIDAFIESKKDIEYCFGESMTSVIDKKAEKEPDCRMEEIEYKLENTDGPEEQDSVSVDTSENVPRIPCKPVGATKEGYANEEKRVFNGWKKQVNDQMEKTGKVVPYERNLNVWRELWSVVERSSVIAEVVDARNPLLYKIEEIEDMARKKKKRYILLMNKSDLLSERQKQAWREYFSREKTEIVFYSSKERKAKELVSLISQKGKTIGMIGQPNVGKSSTINSLCGYKAVKTSSTPGKTKSLQTVCIEELTLYDCPGLVFPQFEADRIELILNGILSLDQTKEVKTCLKKLIEKVGVRRICYTMKAKGFVNDSRKTLEDNVIDAIKKSTGCTNEGKIVKDLIKEFISGNTGYAYPPPHFLSKDYNKKIEQVPADYQVNEEKSYSWYTETQKKKEPELSAEELLYSKKHYLKKGLKREFKKIR